MHAGQYSILGCREWCNNVACGDEEINFDLACCVFVIVGKGGNFVLFCPEQSVVADISIQLTLFSVDSEAAAAGVRNTCSFRICSFKGCSVSQNTKTL